MTAVWTINERHLRRASIARGWYTLNDIAIGLGVSTSTLSRVINGKSAPGHELLASMRLVLGEDDFNAICEATELTA